MAVEMSPKQPTKDFFSSPALSLSLAGIFRNASSESTNPEEDFLGRRVVVDNHEDRTVEMSSENSGPTTTRSRSEDDLDGEDQQQEEEEEGNKRKRKKYHRHTTDQIRHMETLFKETPHPDEKQRQQLSKQLGLAPRQVKFWFQNRRTQIKAIQERHENSLLKAELEKLKEENKAMRESFSKASSCCPNCGGGGGPPHDDLHLENSKLKAELDKLRAALGRTPYPLHASSSSCSDDHEQHHLGLSTTAGVFSLDKCRITEIVNRATLELQKMASSAQPLWLRSVETGREILNYDEYLKEFPQSHASSSLHPRKSIEASRDMGIVFMDAHKLAQSFMDMGEWKEMFSSLISKATIVDVIQQGEGTSRIDGATQLMFGEMQLLTPVVPAREVYFVRSCRQLSHDKWAIVDVSVSMEDEDDKEASLVKCQKRPSGCIIEDSSNGHSKVTWVEHLHLSASTHVHPLFRSFVNTGLAFGAQHWVAALQLHCERLVFYMATNVPTKDSLGVTTLAGRKSVLKMSQRMTQSFYKAIGASSYHQWSKITTKSGQEMRIASRKNIHDPGEPTGVILCASSSLWLPVPPTLLFDFFRDEDRRHEWDAFSKGADVQSIASLSKGKDRGNSVSIQTMKSREKSTWVLQDSSTNSYESVVVYAPVDINMTQMVISGHDPSNIQILPSGFSIIPDGIESRPLVITSREDRNTQGGSLLTLALQTLINPSPATKLSMEAVESVTNLVSVTLKNIKTSFHIQDC
ncbi:unnamed protein product [Cochlearia groenlandica]